MHLKRKVGLTLGIVIIASIALGCAKRPATTTTAAPPPRGAPSAAAPGGAGTAPGSTPAPTGPAPIAPPAGPTSPPPHPREFAAIRELEDIHFDFDKYDIRPGDAAILDANARWMTANPGHLILIEGLADERGTNEYNLALGERRAKTTMNYLVAREVRAERMTIISYGEERPLCTEKNDECWARNRRAHFLVKAQ